MSLIILYVAVYLPLLPGTRTMYRASGSSAACVGFLGYCGGFAAKFVRDERDLASTGRLMSTWSTLTIVQVEVIEKRSARMVSSHAKW